MKARCADAVFYNGRIYTMDENKRSARAVAVSDGEIVRVGGDDEVKRVAPRGCRKLDLGGRVVLPGFIDCHTHFVQMGVDAMNVDLTHSSTIDEALLLMREASKKIPEGEWVIGAGWKESGWRDGRFITAKDLDASCPNHPAVAHRVCGHLSSVNSKAISVLGIDRQTPEVDIDSSGYLTGILRESAVLIPRLATAPDKARRSKALTIATKEAHSLGVTSIDDNGQPEDLETYRTAERDGKLKVRVWYNTPSETLDSMLSMGLSTGIGSNMLKLGGLKVFCDGALGARTAALSEGRARWDCVEGQRSGHTARDPRDWGSGDRSRDFLTLIRTRPTPEKGPQAQSRTPRAPIARASQDDAKAQDRCVHAAQLRGRMGRNRGHVRIKARPETGIAKQPFQGGSLIGRGEARGFHRPLRGSVHQPEQDILVEGAKDYYLGGSRIRDRCETRRVRHGRKIETCIHDGRAETHRPILPSYGNRRVGVLLGPDWPGSEV